MTQAMQGVLHKNGTDAKALGWSFLFHASLIVVALLVANPFWNRTNEVMDFEVITTPQEVSGASHVALRPLTPMPAPQVKARPAPISRAVFGLSRKAVVADDGINMKAGNTVAKARDDLKLKDNDADSIPIPIDEFLVSKMPRLISEVRVPYPPEARSRKIEGVVTLELLIDQKGLVRKATLLNGPGAGLNEAALEAVQKFKFAAAEAGDKKVPVVIRYAYRFIIE
jgi:protein TonB